MITVGVFYANNLWVPKILQVSYDTVAEMVCTCTQDRYSIDRYGYGVKNADLWYTHAKH